MGIARLLDEQQPENMNNSSALTEEVSKNNDPKRPKAKQIFLGIDAHLARNQVARKKDVSVLLTPSGGWRQDLGRVEGARERRHRSQNSAETPEPRRDCRVGAGV